MNTILVVESIPLLRSMLCQILTTIPNVHSSIVVLEQEALALPLSLKPDWIWLDGTNSLSKSRSFIKNLKEFNKDMKIIILGQDDSISDIHGFYQQGVAGYLPKTSNRDDIVEMIQSINDGKVFISNGLLHCITNWVTSPPKKSVKFQLTPREKEVLNLIVEEYSSKEIADKLFVSPCTIETHRLNLIQKLEVKNTAGLVRKAVQERLWGHWVF